jgi:hypothetical protein
MPRQGQDGVKWYGDSLKRSKGQDGAFLAQQTAKTVFGQDSTGQDSTGQDSTGLLWTFQVEKGVGRNRRKSRQDMELDDFGFS